MNKSIAIILNIFFVFSIANSTFADENYGLMGNILNLEYGIEEFGLNNLDSIKDINFTNYSQQKQFNDFKTANETLKNEFISLYKKGIIDYNSISYIIKNYDLFIYHTNKMFAYKKIKEYTLNSKELNNAILSNFRLSKSYYIKIQDTIQKNLNK